MRERGARRHERRELIEHRRTAGDHLSGQRLRTSLKLTSVRYLPESHPESSGTLTISPTPRCCALANAGTISCEKALKYTSTAWLDVVSITPVKTIAGAHASR